MEEKPNYYAIIPAEIRYDNRLKPMEKILYGEITALSDKEGCCWASNNYFAKLYNLTPQAISKYINHLKELNYITIDILYKTNSKEVDKRVIGINIRLIGVSTYDWEGYQHMIKDNNTSINNTSNNISVYDNNNFINNNLLNNNSSINNIIYIYDKQQECECISKSTNKKCKRKASYSINKKNYCNQHAREIFKDLFNNFEVLEKWQMQFKKFYDEYPRKVAKKNVESWFKNNKPKDELFNLIMEKLEEFKQSKDWQKNNGQYIPYPSTWLNQKRWEDENIEQDGMNDFYELYKEAEEHDRERNC